MSPKYIHIPKFPGIKSNFHLDKFHLFIIFDKIIKFVLFLTESRSILVNHFYRNLDE